MLALLVLTLLAGDVPSSGLTPPPDVYVHSSRGKIDVVRGAGLPSTVAGGVASDPGARLVAGDRIQLGEKALINIQVPTGMLQFNGPGEASLVSHSHFQWAGDRVEVAVQGGAVQVSVVGGTVHVAAGLVRLRRAADGAVLVESLTGGQAAVVGPTGVATLQPGRGIRLHQAASGTAAFPLLPAPSLLLPGPHAAMRSFRFKWRAVSDAAAYRLELARDPQFREIVYAQESTAPVISDRARSLPVGLLFWRVATVSRDGFEGVASEPQAIRVAP